jgi:hypothetical protein
LYFTDAEYLNNVRGTMIITVFFGGNMALRLVVYSLAMTVMLYITVILFPEYMNINETFSRFVLTILVVIFFTLSKENWWTKFASLFLGAILFLIFFVLIAS